MMEITTAESEAILNTVFDFVFASIEIELVLMGLVMATIGLTFAFVTAVTFEKFESEPFAEGSR